MDQELKLHAMSSKALNVVDIAPKKNAWNQLIAKHFRGEQETCLTQWALPNNSHKRNVTHPQVTILELQKKFHQTKMPYPSKSLEAYGEMFREKVAPYLINTSSPRFIGHMTSVLPDYMHDISKLISQLNQNVVKVETSKSLTLLEREAIAMLHRSFYQQPNSFYEKHTQNPYSTLGSAVSGGTAANISALWCARNTQLPATKDFAGVSQEGLQKALRYYGYQGAVILGSRLIHYSLVKAASLLGLGTENILLVEQDKQGRIHLPSLEKSIHRCRQKKILTLGLVGLAGSTETGCIDPLEAMAELAHHYHIPFHVDAAWGGALIFSEKHRAKLKGIEQADSISLCGHKQLYLPLGISICLFRNPETASTISTTASYQARNGEFDLGQHSPEGSRPALSLCLHAALHLMGKEGYEQLIDGGIDKTEYMKNKILEKDAFELLEPPHLNILNYRYIPPKWRKKVKQHHLTEEDNQLINEANILLQKKQFEEGRSFVSRTILKHTFYGKGKGIVVLRAVLANPLTTHDDIDYVLFDQINIANQWIKKESIKEKSFLESPLHE